MLFWPAGGARPPSGPITWSGLQDRRHNEHSFISVSPIFQKMCQREAESDKKEGCISLAKSRIQKRNHLNTQTFLTIFILCYFLVWVILWGHTLWLTEQLFTSGHSLDHKGTGAWGQHPSLAGDPRARRGTCPAWHHWASGPDQRPRLDLDLKRNKKQGQVILCG